MILGSLLSGKKDVFGLDIGTWCVNAVWLRKQRDSYRVMAAGRQKVNVAGGDGQWTEAGLVQAIQKCVKSIHIRSKYAICGLCGPDVALRRFEFPLLDESEVANAVLFEAEQVCPFEEGQFIVDYEVINNGFWGPKTGDEQGRDDTTRGILVAVMADMIGSVNQLVRRASLKCVVMDVNGLALLNCFLESENHEDDETIA
ncbi:MAG: pilus assembly protein PilM, partial [Gammaproteobacteria bacterium]|nr:pilus assembly protein PilM [Gammaproteobacteria bacterium]